MTRRRRVPPVPVAPAAGTPGQLVSEPSRLRAGFAGGLKGLFLGLLPATAATTGSALLGDRELIGMSNNEIRPIRGDQVSMVFQEPSTALNPVYTVGWQIIEGIQAHRDISKKDARKRAVELLEMVGMPDPTRRVDYYPHQLSGGQKQRVVIAMAIACDPDVIIADEPTTALDVTVQAAILELLLSLRLASCSPRRDILTPVHCSMLCHTLVARTGRDWSATTSSCSRSKTSSSSSPAASASRRSGPSTKCRSTSARVKSSVS